MEMENTKEHSTRRGGERNRSRRRRSVARSSVKMLPLLNQSRDSRDEGQTKMTTIVVKAREERGDETEEALTRTSQPFPPLAWPPLTDAKTSIVSV